MTPTRLPRIPAMRPLVVALLVACSAVPCLAQRDDRFARVAIVPEHVAGPVHMLQGAGGNIGVSIGDDGVLMIDSQFEPLADKIRATIAELADDEDPDVRLLVNTHVHGDHTGGNVRFGDETVIVAHHNVRLRLQGESADPVSLPVVTYSDRLELHFNGDTLRVVHLPGGHTDGDSYVYFRGAKVAHLGDHFFAGRFPYVDVGRGGSAIGLRDNIARVLEDLPDDVRIIPGHGPLSSYEDLRTYHAMLVDTIEQVRRGLTEGKTLDELRVEGLGERWDGWGDGFITEEGWIQIIVDSYRAEDHN